MFGGWEIIKRMRYLRVRGARVAKVTVQVSAPKKVQGLVGMQEHH